MCTLSTSDDVYDRRVSHVSIATCISACVMAILRQLLAHHMLVQYDQVLGRINNCLFLFLEFRRQRVKTEPYYQSVKAV